MQAVWPTSRALYMHVLKYRIAGNFRHLAPELSAEFFVGSNIPVSMSGNHTYYNSFACEIPVRGSLFQF